MHFVPDDRFDLLLELVELAERLFCDKMRVRCLVAMGSPDDLAASLPRDDVRIEIRFCIWVDALPNVCAEFHEEDLSSMVPVNLVEFFHCLALREGQAQCAQPPRKLPDIDTSVSAGVDHLEDLPELVEPEDVQKEGMELLLFNPVIAVTILQDSLLVSTHQRRLVVQPGWPRATRHELNDKLVNFCQANNVVAIEVQALPHCFQRLQVVDSQLLQLLVERHPQL
mmetsp:Transcript_9188/g.25696  ORF Transcript_9188/g.25696 Transcript_9188/m.25696 type:complete len:225 (+) Transcript_9188:652-1326(+)